MAPFDPPLTADEVRAAFPGRYADLTPLKAGGQGSVFRGRLEDGQEPPGTTVALKIYYADQVQERTARETRALQRIGMDSIVRLIATGRARVRALPCIWLETGFIDGESLASLISAGPMEVPAIARVAIDIAEATVGMWAHRIVHRDIKPDNIMVTPEGRGVLIDLGIARHVDLTSLTTQGKTWGTPGYMSPEHAQARRSLTCHSDVFSLGVVVQEALVGRHPTGRDQRRLTQRGGPRTAGLRNGVPPAFAAIVDRMVSREPHLRPLPQEVAAGFGPFAR